MIETAVMPVTCKAGGNHGGFKLVRVLSIAAVIDRASAAYSPTTFIINGLKGSIPFSPNHSWEHIQEIGHGHD